MQIKVTQNEVKINKDILNDGEYNIHKCQFDFDEEYNGVTNITTTYEDGNEQMYLDIEALKNVWEVTE